MKKLKYPEWEEGRKYLRSEILPRLQEMQRDLFGNEYLLISVAINRDGEHIPVNVHIFKDKEITSCIFVNFFCTNSIEDIESEYTKLTDFIKKYTA